MLSHYFQLGISNTSHVVIYDNNADLGLFSVARVWYMFKVSVSQPASACM